MKERQKVIRHFILTRFNLLLWHKDKDGVKVRTIKWLEHRFLLFEKYCLPSIKNQTCQDFEWIVLFDSTTPESFKEKIEAYQKDYRQFVPVFVEPENGRYFAELFRKEIVGRLRIKDSSRIGELENSISQLKVLTTYLDNDDALNVRFVEDLQQRALTVMDGMFFYYDNGYQLYTDHGYLMKIHYPKNHFVSVVEDGNPSTVRGIFGYGGHFHIDEIEGVKIEHVKAEPMWCEVVHEKNMINDANFFWGTKMVRDSELLRREFAINETVRAGIGLYLFSFLPRYCRTFVKRAKNRMFGRKW